MKSILFIFLLVGAPLFWVALHFFNKEESEGLTVKSGIYLSIYSMAFIYLLFMTQQ